MLFRDLLGDAGVHDAGIEVVFYGADKGTENIHINSSIIRVTRRLANTRLFRV